MTCARISRGRTGVDSSRQRVNGAYRLIPHGSEYLSLSNEKRFCDYWRENSLRRRCRRPRFHRPTIRPPPLKPTVQHGCVFEAEVTQTPPHARRPPCAAGAIQNDTLAFADPEPACGLGKGVR